MPVILGGNTGIYLASLAPAFDPDAQAFITAAAITDPTQQSAINQLVIDLKGYSIWTKMKALYPMVGGTATSMKWNLKDPRDLDIAFRLLFIGGGTWDANGYTPNGSNGYADTKLNPLLNLSQNSTHISYYSRTNNDANSVEIGVRSGASIDSLLQIKVGNVFVAAINESYNGALNAANTNGQGFYVGNRTASNLRNNWKNGSKQYTATSTSGTQANLNYFIGALGGGFYSTKQCAFSSIGDGLTDTEAANFYTAVQTFQTTLGRNV